MPKKPDPIMIGSGAALMPVFMALVFLLAAVTALVVVKYSESQQSAGVSSTSKSAAPE